MTSWKVLKEIVRLKFIGLLDRLFRFLRIRITLIPTELHKIHMDILTPDQILEVMDKWMKEIEHW